MNHLSNPVEQVDLAFYYIFGIAGLLIVFITAIMIYFVIRYHRSRNPVASPIKDNLRLEVLWTVIPTLLVLTMFYVGWSAYTGLRTVPEGALEIEVIAQKYSWLFIYPNEIELENELVVPVGTPVKLNITSTDILHSFFLPAFRVKVDAVNGLVTYAWFMANPIGQYDIQCTEFCGTGHAEMNAVLKIVSEADYRDWLVSQGVSDDQDSETNED